MLILSGEGRVTKTPELRTTASGELMTTVTVASNGGGSEDTAIYVDLVLWEVQAAFAARHLTKGWNITFSGHLRPAAGNGPNGEHQEAVQICNVRLDYGPKPPPVDEPDKQVGAMSSNGSPIEGTDVVDDVMTNQDCRDVLEAKLQFKPAIAVVEGLARQELGESWLETINARRKDAGHPVISGLDAKAALSELWHTQELRDRIGDERAQRALDLNNIINTADHDNVKGTWRAGNAARATQLAQQLRSDLERGRFDSPESTARTPGAQVAILGSTRAGEDSGQSGQARGEDCHQRAMNLCELGRYREAARLFQEAVAAKQLGDENGLPDPQSIAKSMAAVGDCCSAVSQIV